MPGPMGGGRPGRGNAAVNVSDQKAKHLWRTWGRILVYSKKLLIPMGIALVFSITASVLSLLGPTYLSRLTDAVQAGLFVEDGIVMKDVVNAVSILVTIYAVSAVVHIAQSFIMADVTVSISKRMRNDISNKINVLPMKYFNQHTTGDILSRVTNDVDTIGQSLNMAIGTLFGAITLFVGAIIMMFVTNWIMAFTGIVASLIGFAIMMIIMSRSQKYFLRQQKHLGEIDGHIEEVYSGHTIVKAYNGEDHEREKFETMNNNLRQSNFRANSLSGLMMPLMTFVGNLAYVAVCVVGAVLTKNGTITIGVIVAFMVYVRLFTSPLSQIAQAFQQLQSAAAAGERVFEFLDEEPLADESDKPRLINWNTHGDVKFDHVQFGYEDTNKIVIHDLCAEARSGEKIAIVGPTGAGKTTIVNVLMRFHDLTGGDIYIDGVNTKDMSRQEVRDNFCMVLQDTWLFEGTIRENLVYNLKDVPDSVLDEACETVGLTHLINTLPEGYDTVVSDNASLSEGQKQQLTIARAIIANKPILILDEATSSIDTRTELKIQEAMDKLMQGRTTFVIAHRLSTIKNADWILVLNEGDVIEQGTHETLLEANGFYADLYRSQFDPV